MSANALRSRLLAALAGTMVLVGTGPAIAQVERVDVNSSAFALGTLTPEEGALPRTLWRGTERQTVATLLGLTPTRYADPLYNEYLRRVLLSPGEGPAGADNRLAAQKLLLAAEAGYYEDAAALAALVPITSREPSLGRIIAYRELMNGQVETACARGAGLEQGQVSPFWLKLRYLCYVRTGESAAADLTLGLLEREEGVLAAELRRLSAFGRNAAIIPPPDEADVFDVVMLAGSDAPVEADFVARAPLGVAAAIARRSEYPVNLREIGLLRSLRAETIGPSEGRLLLDTMAGSDLAARMATVAEAMPQSPEQTAAIAAALTAGTGYDGFAGRAALLRETLGTLSPRPDIAPGAGVAITLALIANEQFDIADRFLSAMGPGQTIPAAPQQVRTLIELMGLKVPERASRLASVRGFRLDAEVGSVALPAAPGAPLPAPLLTSLGLEAAASGAEGVQSLLYLVTLSPAGGDDGVREAVNGFLADRLDLSFLNREAAFRSSAERFLPIASGGVGVAN